MKIQELLSPDYVKRVNQWTEVVEEIMRSDVLRNYQQEMLDRLEEAWKTCRSVMMQMPTGTGKMVLMAEVVRSEKRKVKSEKLADARTDERSEKRKVKSSLPSEKRKVKSLVGC